MTSYDRRLATVEAALSPTQLVLRWLEEAHRYHDMTGYMQSLVDRPIGDFPMDRLAREAQESARIRSRGRSRAEADKIARRPLVETMFRGQLVLEINVRSQNVLDREGLIYVALVGQVGIAIRDSDVPLEGPTIPTIHRCLPPSTRTP